MPIPVEAAQRRVPRGGEEGFEVEARIDAGIERRGWRSSANTAATF